MNDPSGNRTRHHLLSVLSTLKMVLLNIIIFPKSYRLYVIVIYFETRASIASFSILAKNTTKVSHFSKSKTGHLLYLRETSCLSKHALKMPYQFRAAWLSPS